MAERVCTTCVFCVRQDHGYSNWTVEGTNVDCLKNLNPGFPDEEPYKETPEHMTKLDFGKTCNGYREGIGPYLDCDTELMPYTLPRTAEMFKAYTDDPEAAQLLVDGGF